MEIGLPLRYAIGLFVADAPWYFMACVPFWISRRLRKSVTVSILLAIALLRATAGFFTSTYLPDWEMWDTYYFLLNTFIMFAAYLVCFKTHFAKLLYTMLMLLLFATSVNHLAHLIVQPFYPNIGIGFVAEPAWIIVTALLIAVAFPFFYRLFNDFLRRVFSEFSNKTILSLCTAPALFYAINSFYLYAFGTFTNTLISILILFTGLISSYINVRMVLDAAKYFQNQQALVAESAALERMNLMKTELMATISHETRTPLAVLSGYAGLISMELRAKGVDEQTAADLDKIAAEAQRVATMMEEMQKLSRQKDSEVKRTPLDIGEVVRQIARLYAPILERHGIRLELDIEAGLPLIFGSPDELTQVMFNLLSNAQKHTDGGAISVKARSERNGFQPKAGGLGFVEITIKDAGAGIPAEFLPHVFEKHVHGENTGSGLGLFLCKEIVESHGGRISIESELGVGAAVRFALPIHKIFEGA